MQDSAGTRVNVIILRRRTFTQKKKKRRLGLCIHEPVHMAHMCQGYWFLHVGLLRVLGCELCLERNQICPDVLSNHNNAVMT